LEQNYCLLVQDQTMTADPGAEAVFDVLTDVMDQLRLEGTVYFAADLRSPWGIEIDRPDRAPFYAIRTGRCEIGVGDEAPREVRAGDFLLLPAAARHVVRSDSAALIAPFDDWLATHPMDARGHTAHRGSGAVPTRVTGGFFSFDLLRRNPLFEALPPLIHLRGDDPAVARWLEPTLQLVDAEVAGVAHGGRAVLRRLADVLFIQAVRAYIGRHSAGAASFLRGLADPPVARTLALIHARYAQPWTLPALARAVGVSRTGLAVRFRELVGESPMAYLARWRITRAANRLRDEPTSLARIAEASGFASPTVFAKTFRRVTGQTPARWRRRGLAP
jgi:AraC-like DNA-binding protein/mannose-6-phosphate isomerase-like protein (cupin superfamily)